MVPIMGFECRNLDPVRWHPRDGFTVTSASGKKVFEDVDLSDEWTGAVATGSGARLRAKRATSGGRLQGACEREKRSVAAWRSARGDGADDNERSRSDDAAGMRSNY